MAGSYSDVPSHRIAYDLDGTVMWKAYTPGDVALGGDTAGFYGSLNLPPSEQVLSTKQEYNDEDSVEVEQEGGPGDRDIAFAWVFPEKRDFFGFFGDAHHQTTDGKIKNLESSTDTTNGISGDWTELAAIPDQFPGGYQAWGVHQAYREFIGKYTSTGVRSVRIRIEPVKSSPAASDQCKLRAWHLYGDFATGANPDRLLFIDDDTGLEYDEVQDWGDIPRGSVHDKEIFLRNNSATLAASSNVISFEGLFEDSYQWYSIRDNSGASTSFSTSLTINGPIAAGARYPVASTDTFTLRLDVPASTNLGPHAARLELATGTWA